MPTPQLQTQGRPFRQLHQYKPAYQFLTEFISIFKIFAANHHRCRFQWGTLVPSFFSPAFQAIDTICIFDIRQKIIIWFCWVIKEITQINASLSISMTQLIKKYKCPHHGERKHRSFKTELLPIVLRPVVYQTPGSRKDFWPQKTNSSKKEPLRSSVLSSLPDQKIFFETPNKAFRCRF